MMSSSSRGRAAVIATATAGNVIVTAAIGSVGNATVTAITAMTAAGAASATRRAASTPL